jgi:hypothetical protein
MMSRFDAIHAGHANIQQNHVGRRITCDFERLFSVSGLPDNFVFIKIGKEAAQPVASRCLIVNDKYSHA